MVAILEYDDENLVNGIVVSNARLTPEGSDTDIREVVIKIDKTGFKMMKIPFEFVLNDVFILILLTVNATRALFPIISVILMKVTA